MPPLNSTSFGTFLAAFFKQLWTALSAVAGAPLFIATFYVSSEVLKLLCALAAVGCAIFASYRLWRHERLRFNQTSVELERVKQAQSSTAGHAMIAAPEEPRVALQHPPNSTNVRYIYADGDPLPCCLRCWEVDRKLIHLSEAQRWNGGVRRHCVGCYSDWWEEPMNLNPRPRGSYT